MHEVYGVPKGNAGFAWVSILFLVLFTAYWIFLLSAGEPLFALCNSILLYLLIFNVQPVQAFTRFYRSKNFVALHDLGVSVQWARGLGSDFATGLYGETRLRGKGERRWLYVGEHAFTISGLAAGVDELAAELKKHATRILDNTQPHVTQPSETDIQEFTSHGNTTGPILRGLVWVVALFGMLELIFFLFTFRIGVLLEERLIGFGILFGLIVFLVEVGRFRRMIGRRRMMENGRTYLVPLNVQEVKDHMPWGPVPLERPFYAPVDGTRLGVILSGVESARTLIAIDKFELSREFEKQALTWDSH